MVCAMGPRLRFGIVALLISAATPAAADTVRIETAPYSRRQSELKPVKAVTALDAHTVRIELSEPSVPLLAHLADRAGMMVSPKAARELGEKFSTRPVCAGPFKFVEWVAQD